MMKLICKNLLAATLLISTAMVPVCAQSTNQSSTSTGVASHLKGAPGAVTGFTCGFIAGIPICAVRYLRRETMNGAHGLVGSFMKDTNNPAILVPAAICWLPAALLVAGIEAPVYAFKNAYMADKPFSKEQFSLGELEDPVNP